jgi:Glyoxalase/Bleomycin resistance protein/Dioxygenase superfamily
VAPPFDLLASADFLVPDRDAAVATVQRALGFVEPKPRWSHGGPGHGHRVTFCRPHPSFRQSPTLVELIEAADVDPTRSLTEVVPNVAGLAALQGDRPLKTHGMPVAASDVAALIERVRGRGLRHWVQPSSDAFPFLRLWMGITADDLSGYRPDGDGGLMLEVVDTAQTGLPPEALDEPPPELDDGTPGTMVRTATRGVLVDDIDRTLEQLADVFDWEPELGPERGDGGSRRALLGFRLAQSARVELIEPAGDGDDAAFLRQWGAGIWHVRIAVTDLDAKADDLRARGTPFTTVPTGLEDPETVLRVGPDATPACRFEFGALAR